MSAQHRLLTPCKSVDGRQNKSMAPAKGLANVHEIREKNVETNRGNKDRCIEREEENSAATNVAKALNDQGTKAKVTDVSGHTTPLFINWPTAEPVISDQNLDIVRQREPAGAFSNSRNLSSDSNKRLAAKAAIQEAPGLGVAVTKREISGLVAKNDVTKPPEALKFLTRESKFGLVFVENQEPGALEIQATGSSPRPVAESSRNHVPTSKVISPEAHITPESIIAANERLQTQGGAIVDRQEGQEGYPRIPQYHNSEAKPSLSKKPDRLERAPFAAPTFYSYAIVPILLLQVVVFALLYLP